jgi:outer membrane cobalamin receptor
MRLLSCGRSHGAFAVLLLAACYSMRGSGSSHPVGSGRVITAEAIERSGARNAWEVLERGEGVVVATSDELSGDPDQLRSRRGKSSILLKDSDTPLVVVDGARYSRFDILRAIPATSIARMQILNGIEATSALGTNAGGGAVVVYLKK